jgi:hypothetical protein
MFFILRFVRGIFGAIFGLLTLQVLVALLTLIMNFESVSVDFGKFFALLLIQVVVMLASGITFLWLRKVINNLHEKKFGLPHPKLAEKKWNL